MLIDKGPFYKFREQVTWLSGSSVGAQCWCQMMDDGRRVLGVKYS